METETVLANHIKNKKFSHGYFLCGDFHESNETAREMAKRIFCDTKNFCGKCEPCLLDINKNPDFFCFDREKFQIEDSRRLKELAFKKSFNEGGVKVFQLKFREISKEAQNALLKIMEEPPRGTHFFICAIDEDSIIDTLKSRLVLLSNKQNKVVNRPFARLCDERAWSPAKREERGVTLAKSLAGRFCGSKRSIHQTASHQTNIENKINLFSKSNRQEAEDLLLGFLDARHKEDKIFQNSDNIKKIEKSLIFVRENLPLNLISLYLFS